MRVTFGIIWTHWATKDCTVFEMAAVSLKLNPCEVSSNFELLLGECNDFHLTGEEIKSLRGYLIAQRTNS